MKSTNQTLWNSVSETNPNNTKAVEFGRSFTAIDAYSQIAAATTAQYRVLGSRHMGYAYPVRSEEEIKEGQEREG